MKQTCILVLGMHRSGTSAVAGILDKIGINMGRECLPPAEDNPKGFFENIKIKEFNDKKLLPLLSSRWDDISLYEKNWHKEEKFSSIKEDAKKLLQKEYANENIFAIKDPRMSILFPFWEDVLNELKIDIKVILVYRSGEEVIQSLSKRNSIDYFHALLLYIKYFLLAEYYSRHYNRISINYLSLLNNPSKILKKIFNLLENQRFFKKEDIDLNDFLDPALRHFRPTEIFIDHKKLPDFAYDFIKFLDKKDISFSKQEYKNLEKIYKNYKIFLNSHINNSPYYINLLNEYEKAIDKKNQKLKEYSNALNEKNRLIKLRDEVISHKNLKIDEYEQAIDKKNQKLKEYSNALNEKNRLIKLRDEVISHKNLKIDEYEQAIDKKNQKLKEYSDTLNEKNRLIELKNETITTLEYQNKKLQKDKDALNSKNQKLIETIDENKRYMYELELKAIKYRDLAESLRLKNRMKRALLIDNDGYIYKTYINIKKYGWKNTIVKIKQKVIDQNKTKNKKITTKDKIQTSLKDMENIKKIVEKNYLIIPKIQPKVSIIVLTKDGLKHIKRLLKSIKENTLYKNYEIIIVDNDSKDKTVEFLETNTYNLPIKIIKNNFNASFSAGNNQAVKKANGEYVLFLNNDIEPLKGWLCHLVTVLQKDQNIGSVGSQLLYPYSPQEPLSLKVQHSGIAFRYDYIEQMNLSFFRPYNLGVGKKPIVKNNSLQIGERVAITAACLLMKKEVFNEVKGFDEDYDYGYEDVDLGLKLYKKGYKNYYCQNSILFHYESSTQKLQSQKDIKGRRIHNIKILHRKWYQYIKYNFFFEKLKNTQNLFSEKGLKIAFAVTEAGENAVAGDYFTAFELAKSFKEMGYEYTFLKRRGGDWLRIPKDVDIVISMLDAYDLNQIKNRDKKILSIAWIRNWPDRWLKNPSFLKYDLVFASSKKLCDLIYEKSGKKAYLFPIATDPNAFDSKKYIDTNFKSDYVFTGNYWGKPREIEKFLEPQEIDFKFSIYGKDWNFVEKFKPYHKGFIKYKDIPKVYANTKIVIDDAVEGITKPFGSVNSRVFDALGAGVLVVTNGEIGAKELFGDLLPTYNSKDELHKHLNHYLSNKQDRDELIKKLKKIIISNHTYRIRAQFMKQKIEEFLNIGHSIAIKMPIPKWNEAKNWGDYHFAVGLKKEFEKLGYHVILQILPEWDNQIGDSCDVVLVLRGLSVYKPKKHQFNIMWNISHPDKISIDEYNLYDMVFVSSDIWAEKLKNISKTKIDVLHQCTDIDKFKPFKDEKYKTELLFVGNSRNVFRKVIRYIIPPKYELSIYGTLWEKFIDKKYIKGKYIDNSKLYKYYSNADIVLNDHWDSMSKNGFISNRIFDVLSCRGFIITDDVVGLNKLFDNVLPTYKTKEDLEKLIDFYMKNPEKRYNIAKKGYEIVTKQHTYKNRAIHINSVIEKYLDRDFLYKNE